MLPNPDAVTTNNYKKFYETCSVEERHAKDKGMNAVQYVNREANIPITTKIMSNSA